MSLVTKSKDLAAVCARLAGHEFVTVDTEFVRETTFWPVLCVVQLASDDEAVAVDAMADDIDLSPIFELMLNERVVKVFHAARQDLEIFWNLAKLVPKPLFDTQVAAMVCGFGEQISYGELVEAVTGRHVDKSSRFTDWGRRPLSQAQIDYAIADVTHLRDVYRALNAKLAKTGRAGWLGDEMASLELSDTYEQHPERAYERFKHRARKPRDLAALMEVCAWREREAQTRDVPRGRILKDDAMVDIALAAPRSLEALAHLRSAPRGIERNPMGEHLLAAIERALARDPATPPELERPSRNGGGATVELLKVLLRQASEESGVAAKMIATTDDLEAIAASDRAEVPALAGWRRRVFGARALELKKGNLALTVENGRVAVLEWQDGAKAGVNASPIGKRTPNWRQARQWRRRAPTSLRRR